MRIAQVVSSYHPRIGGVETHVRHLAEGCAAAGDHVTVLTHQVGNTKADEWAEGVRVLRFPLTISSRNYPFSVKLYRYLRLHAADFDLVHAHNYHTLIGHAAIRSGLPVVFTPHYHGTGHTPIAAFLHRVYRPAGARQFLAATAVICVSEAERELVIKDFPGAEGKVMTIANGTDRRQITSDKERGLLGAPVVLTVGRLERYKNVDLIIKAFRALPYSAIFLVVGDGPDRARLERQVEAGGPGCPVIFTGNVSGEMLNRIFEQANIITSASDHEAFGLTLMEGLVSGARVVASDIPAHVALARLAGPDAPVSLVDPRNTTQFTSLLSESLTSDRIQSADFRMPSWTEVVGNTRELYSRIYSHATELAPVGPV